MTYAFRKKQAGQEVVKKLTFYLNLCKYTQLSYRTINSAHFKSPFDYAPGYTGAVLVDNVQAGLYDLWGLNIDVYAQLVSPPAATEIFKLHIDGAGAFSLIERGVNQTAQQLLYGNFKIYHLGQLDGSCYGYSQTCSASDSYQENLFKEIIFSSAPLAAGTIYHGGLNFKDVSYNSAELKPGEGIASRSKLTFKLSDQTHNDYDLCFWDEQKTSEGTLFGKLLARNPYFNNRKIKYSVGLRDSSSFNNEIDWEDRIFLIDDVNLSDETFAGSALDPLILTEGKKAKMPLVSPAQLTVAIVSGSTQVQFGNASVSYFGTSGTIIVRIDSELIAVTANGTASMPIVTRGFGHSEIKDHSVNGTVQNCVRFLNEHVINCIVYALETWTSVPAAYIDDYTDVIALIPASVISDYTLSSSKDVVDFINMCIFIGNLSFYFDDVTQKIVIKYISEFNISPIYLSDLTTIKKESAKRDFNFKEQYTRFNLSWAPFNLTKEDDLKNYQVSITSINALLESPNQLGETNERKAMMLPMLTASSADYLLGAAAVQRITDNSFELPDILECEVDAETVGETQGSIFELGAIVNAESRSSQNKAGVSTPRLYQILKISGDPFISFKVKMKHFQLLEPTDYDFTINAGVYVNYVLTDNYNPLIPGVYVVYIKTGAIFGSYSIGLPAFKTGTPTAGVTFRFIARWQVLGMGGQGGNGGLPTGTHLGQIGGIAFEANCNVEIDNGAGLIWAGGGGGEGTPSIPTTNGWGGGGGQGFGVALGGFNSTSGVNTTHAPSGNQSSPGYGPGGHGGKWGENGELFNGPLVTAGIAIKSNGFAVTITSGDNILSIRGLRT